VKKGAASFAADPIFSSTGIRSSLCGTNLWKVSAVHGSSVQSVIAVAGNYARIARAKQAAARALETVLLKARLAR
jgi:hypothetical protein